MNTLKQALGIFFVTLKVLGQNNLILFTESAEPIQIEYQHQLYPMLPQSDVKITKITEDLVPIKIIFSNKAIPSIDTILPLYHPSEPLHHQDIIYAILKDNKTIKYLATLPSSDIQPVIPEIDTTIQVKTREEKNIQKIIFFNDTSSLCLNSLDTADFNKVIKHIDNTVNLDSKITLIEQFIHHNCFNQAQAQDIIERVPFEVERLKIIKLLMPKLTDVFNLWKWHEYLKFTTAKESYTEYYKAYLNSIKTKPLINDSILQVLAKTITMLQDDIRITGNIKSILSHYSIHYSHLEKILSSIIHDQYKEELLMCAFYSLKDKKDFLKAVELVNFQETKNRLKKFYEQQK